MRTTALGAILAICCLAFGSTAWASECKHEFGAIRYEDLAKAVKDKKVTLLDLNGSESFKKAHIPGAIDFEANQKDLKKQLPEDKETLIVAYCGGPKCGAWQRGAKAAKSLGYTNVKHFKDGLSGWLAKGTHDLKKESAPKESTKKSCRGGCGGCSG